MPLTDIALGNTSALSGDCTLSSFGLNANLWHAPAIFTTTSFACLEGVEPSSLGLEAIILAIGRQTHVAHRERLELPTFGFGDHYSTN